MKKIAFLLICILTSLVNTNAQTYYKMWRSNSGESGKPEWICNSSMWYGITGIEFTTGDNPQALFLSSGRKYILDRSLNSEQNKDRVLNIFEKDENNPFNSQFIIDGNMSAKRLVVADLATSHDNIQFYNTSQEAFLEANGDEAGLHIRSMTGQRIHLHDQVTIGRSNYEKFSIPGTSLTVCGGVFIGPKGMAGGPYDITSKTDKFLLWVQKGIVSENFALAKVADWSDHVFNSDYALRPLSEVENFVRTHRHLPDVPSEKEVKKEGYNLHDMNKIFMQKIEELTLYVIEQQKEIDRLKERLEDQ